MLLDITIETRKGRGFIQPQWAWITYDNGDTWEQVYDMRGNPILWCQENIQDIKKLCQQLKNLGHQQVKLDQQQQKL